ncbi:FAD:protein FMN transferase [Williamsia sp. MIQD14]|uniref:FAD:protein FMN transferase n=1 Tax=Williamsia sp. MIQD14 TaxID=3425703 RepID=UPI003DA05A0B
MTTSETATSTWPVWGLEASLVVTDPARLGEARAIVDAVLADVDAACSRFRPDAELYGRSIRRGRPTRITPVLATLVDAALDAARASDGAVDPTIGRRLIALGYDRDFADVLADRASGLTAGPSVAVHEADHTMIRRHADTLTVPEGVLLDLGATAKAVAADLAADVIADEIGCGAMVNLGGDISARGQAPAGGWQILVQDLPVAGGSEPATQIGLVGDCAVATSSTLRRQWNHRGRTVHHIVDPSTGQPASGQWRTVTVVARRCVDANTLSTGAIVKGAAGQRWIESTGLPARLVAADGTVIGTGGWPRDAEMAA